ncbi:MAG: extracellular solute-binding protein [Pseudomonadales bacterium]
MSTPVLLKRWLYTAACGLWFACLPAQSDEEAILNIYNWADYIDPYSIKEFEEEYGIHVNYDLYDSSEIVDTKLMTGNSGYDLIFHSVAFSARLIPIGAYQPVDFSRLKNWHHIDKRILARISKATGTELYGVPYMWGTTGFAYNVEMVKERMSNAPLTSADLIFKPENAAKFADCGISLLDDPTSVIPMAMLYLGLPVDSVEAEHLAAVEELLGNIRPYIKYFSSNKMIVDLPSKEICIGMSWSGDFSQAQSRAIEAGLDIKLNYFVPIEGAVDWYDNIYIPVDAEHVDNAHKFLDFLLRPEVIARASNYIGYANANKTSTTLVDPIFTENPAIYPDEEVQKLLTSNKILLPKQERKRSRSWTRIKAGL